MLSGSEDIAMEEEWCYRGEGNASIVVACAKKNIVYRIKKVDKDGTIKAKTDLNVLDFVKNFMKSFISFQFLVPMKSVKLPDGLIEKIQTSWRHLRPENRLCKNVDCASAEAIEMPDLCFLYPANTCQVISPTYTFEIKPKWGLLPVGESVSGLKKSNCRFCMHQFLKIKDEKWPRKSLYCPIDLFSGCATRMKYALCKLHSCPQNNFCIYRNGQKIWSNKSLDEKTTFGDCLDSASTDELFDVVVKSLLYPDKGYNSTTSLHTRQLCHLSSCEHLCNDECDRLSAGCVLSQILDVQNVDDIDHEELHSHFIKASHAFSTDSELRRLHNMDGPYSHWLELPLLDSIDPDVAYSILKIKQYLVSRSAKDCSILITVQLINLEGQVSENSESPARTFFITSDVGNRYLCCVTIIDLDPKSFNKIPAYVEEEKNVVGYFLESSQAAL